MLKGGELENAIKTFQALTALTPDDPMPYYYMGLTYFRLGNHDPAIEALEKALKLNPALARAHTGLGSIYESKGENYKARNEYNAAIEGGDRPAGEMLRRLDQRERIERAEKLRGAGVLFNEGKLEEALKELNLLLKWNPDDIDALYNSGFIYARIKRYREALGRFMRIVELDPSYITAHLQLGYIYHSLGVYAEAKKEFETVIGIAPEGEEAGKARERLQDVEKRIAVAEYFKQASELRDKKDLQAALSVALKILEIEPRNTRALYDSAVTYHMMDKREEAIEALKKAIRIDPGYAAAHFELGGIYELLGRKEDAVAEYEAASGKEGEESRKAAERLETLKRLEEAKERSGRIKAFLEGGDLQSALQEAEAYVLEEKKNPGAHYTLGRIYSLLGKREEVIERLKIAVQIDPKYWDAYLLMGEIYEVMKRYSEARDAYKSVISGAPDSPQGSESVKRTERVNITMHFERAKELAGKGDFEGALAEMQKLLEIAPDNPVALFNAGVIYDRLDRPEEAESYLRKAIGINPEYVEAHAQLGLLYDRMQRFDEAREEYLIVSSLVKEGREAKIAKARLGLLQEAEVFAEGMSKANALIAAGNYADALKEIEVVVTVSPGNYVAHYTLGYIYDRLEMRDEAISALKRSIEIKDDYATAHLILGTVYEKESLFSDAREEYKKVISLAEGTREGELAAVKLRNLKNWKGNFSVSHSIDTNLSYGVQKILGVGTSYGLSLSYYLLRGQGKLLSAGFSNSRSVSYKNQLWGDGYGANLRWEMTLRNMYKLAVGGNYNYSIYDNEPSYWKYGLSGDLTVSVNAIPTSMSIRYNFSDTYSYKNKTSNTYLHSVNLSASQRFSPVDTVSWGYGLSNNINKDPIGSNYATRSNSLSLSYSRTIKPGLTGSASYSFSFINYTNPDSTTLFQMFRRNTNNGINLGLSYSLSENVSMSISYNYNDVATNLPPPSAEERRKLSDILSDPIPTVGGGYRKDVIGFGVGVAF